MSGRDPLSDPQWHALARESKLVRQLLGSGVTALGNANYADGKGNYYVAFFALSVGIERLCKLVLVADFAITNGSVLPPQNVIRKFGHRIAELLDAVDQVSSQRKLQLRFKRPEGEIEQAIIASLESFADASRGRYANYASLGDPNVSDEFEPLRLWWNTVADRILKLHFRDSPREKRARENARLIGQLMSPVSMVLHTAEDGTRLDDPEAASYRTGETEVVQKYGRFYTLTIIRWLSSVFTNLTMAEGYGRTPVVFGHYEHFTEFGNDDSLLKSRKKWP